jgi:outer membrane protein assembly factor BamB
MMRKRGPVATARWLSVLAGGFYTLSLVAGLPRTASAEDWPQFRGPNASGVATESKNLPVTFAHDKNVRWSAEIGEGIACPVICNGKTFSTAMVGDKKFGVFCFDAATGKELWKRTLDTGPLPAIMSPNTHASSTPACDAERVYVYFSTLGLMAFDAATGDTVWTRPLDKPFYLMGWGAAASPIIHEDLVIFNRTTTPPFLVAIDRTPARNAGTPPRHARYAVVCRPSRTVSWWQAPENECAPPTARIVDLVTAVIMTTPRCRTI